MACGSPTLMPLRNCEFCELAVPRALYVPCRPPDVPPTSGLVMSRLGTLYSTSDQMSRPPGVPCSSCSLRFTATVADVVSTTGELPVTVTVSASVATIIFRSTGVVWPVRTLTPSRMTVRKPESSTFTV